MPCTLVALPVCLRTANEVDEQENIVLDVVRRWRRRTRREKLRSLFIYQFLVVFSVVIYLLFFLGEISYLQVFCTKLSWLFGLSDKCRFLKARYSTSLRIGKYITLGFIHTFILLWQLKCLDLHLFFRYKFRKTDYNFI
jgi:high-affinity nickel permease